jgi:hypothetical protein
MRPLVIPQVMGERADHEHHHGHRRDEGEREDAADGAGMLEPELTRQARLAE